jgi:hypothetical protein
LHYFATVHKAGDRVGDLREVEHYSLDVIISVGYRVKSHRGVQFRVWATQQLRDYLVKGFVLNDEKFKQGKGSNYFEQLLARIRDIRSSEKEFWRKVLEIYATSIDYDPRAEALAGVLRHGAEQDALGDPRPHRGRADRAIGLDAAKPHAGLTVWPKGQAGPPQGRCRHRRKTTSAPEELRTAQPHRLAAYLDFAVLQASNQRPMYMRDWIAKARPVPAAQRARDPDPRRHHHRRRRPRPGRAGLRDLPPPASTPSPSPGGGAFR